MDTQLWNLEDKWKLTTQKVVAIFACTSFLVIVLSLFGALIRWRKLSSTRGSTVIVHQEPASSCKNNPSSGSQSSMGPGRCSVMSALTGTVRWSPRQLREYAPAPLLVKRDVWHSHNSTSAVWQRPILMGGKCELPRFSGLILYDGKGLPLHHCDQQGIITTAHDQEQVKSHLVPRTTLKDLL